MVSNASEALYEHLSNEFNNKLLKAGYCFAVFLRWVQCYLCYKSHVAINPCYSKCSPWTCLPWELVGKEASQALPQTS